VTTPGTAASVSPFRRRTLFILIGVGAVSLAIALVLAAFSEDFTDKQTVDTNGYSRSAIGYEALIELLREVDVPVLVSKNQSAKRAHDGLLVVIAPELVDDHVEADIREMVAGSRRVLVVLPRWYGFPDERQPAWIDERHELSEHDARRVLAALRIEGEITRAETALVVPDGAAAPNLANVQLIVEHDLAAEIDAASHDGILLGHTWYDRDTELWVLADPSPLDNAGLRRDGNPRFAVELIDRLRAGGPVVFDETTHGFEETPSLWKKLIEFPLVLVSLQVLVCAALLLWAAVGRWGPPRGVPAPLPSGKDFLIRNTADLLHVGGHDREALRRYLATTVHHVRQTLHAPRDLDPAGIRGWLERVRESRRGTVPLPELERDVDEAARAPRGRATSRRIVELAARIHRWRTEMTHGPHDHP
jgi:hypothetical protein